MATCEAAILAKIVEKPMRTMTMWSEKLQNIGIVE
jgi:hypothetical protein